MTTPIQQRRKDNKFTWRMCEICRKQTNGLSSLCNRHRRYRGKNGSPKVARPVRYKDYASLVALAVKYFKKNPPPQNILESMARFLTPPDAIPRGSRTPKRAEKERLRYEMQRWNDPRYRKVATDHGGWKRAADYSPRGVLAVLVAITAYVDERESGWPHDSDLIEKARAIVRLWKRPRYMAGKTGAKRSSLISPSVLRGLAARLREFSMINVFALVTARAILAEYRAQQKKLADVQRALASRSAEEKQAALAVALEKLKNAPVPDPGPRPIYRVLGDLDRIRAWEVQHARWRAYVEKRPTPNPKERMRLEL